MATVDFMRKVVENTPASRDQEHLSMVVCSASTIPDRTAFLLGEGPDPFPAMHAALRLLEDAGVTRIAIPCNTAHHWHAALQAETPVRILHIVDAVADTLARTGVRGGPIGVLATDGTLEAGVYQNRLAGRGFACVAPGAPAQAEVMRAIRLVKAGEVEQASVILQREARSLLAAGCVRVVMACTEVPIALERAAGDLEPWLLDATQALARSCVELERAGGPKAGLVGLAAACTAPTSVTVRRSRHPGPAASRPAGHRGEGAAPGWRGRRRAR
jgi:aspartate racemase